MGRGWGRVVLNPELVEKAFRIVLEDTHQKTTLEKNREGWGVLEQSGFPADIAALGRVFLQLGEDKIDRLVTDKPEGLGDLGLVSPAESNSGMDEDETGLLITLADDNGKPLVQLVVGNARTGSGEGQGGGTYIRFFPEQKGYLVFSNLNISSNPADWLEKKVTNFEGRKEIRKMVITPPGGKKLYFGRDKEDSPWDSGEKNNPANQMAVGEAADAMGRMTLMSVLRNPSQNLENPTRIDVELFSGMVYTLRVSPKTVGEGNPILVSAAVEKSHGGDGPLQAAADRFNKRMGTTVLLMEGWKAKSLLKKPKDYYR
ncbi:MAG: DUF4340 domain-containing protein [Deltaproteobacteria bacterium]|nr:DUF4340 domain-containing protein [Deltaproteobacteria bacterium]